MHIRPKPITRMLHAAVAVAVLCLPTIAAADAYADVDQLIRDGQAAQAVAKADQHLSAMPRDPRMRLLKGVALTESGRSAQAVALFSALTEDYPELPEPYNNLGVIYAGIEQFDKARTAFEMAIQTSPKYLAAYENLGDVHASMAGQAYAKAFGLDLNNQRLRPKLTLVRDLLGAPGSVASTLSSMPALGTGVAAKAIFAAPAPVRVAAAVPAAAPLEVALAVPEAAPALAANTAADDEIHKAVGDWAAAWSARDIPRYFAAYGSDFRPADAMARKTWEELRRIRILGKTRINLKLGELAVAVNGTSALVRFRQDYAADGLVSSDFKTLEMSRAGGRWLITRESTGS